MPKDISELPCCLGEQGNVLAELCQPDQEDLLHQLAGGPLLRTMVSGMMVGRLMVQCARYPRVSESTVELSIGELLCLLRRYLAEVAHFHFLSISSILPFHFRCIGQPCIAE